MIPSWIRQLFKKTIHRCKSTSTSRNPLRRRLVVETLEDRVVPTTFTVLNAFDDGSMGSLRWAVGQANTTAGADAINFDANVFATSQTITLTQGELALSDELFLTGPGASVLTVSGNQVNRIFNVISTVQISGLTISDGNSQGDNRTFGNGGGLYNSGNLTLVDSIVSGNTSIGSGGGICNDYSGTFTMIRSTVSGNRSRFGAGGGLMNFETMIIANSTISGNTADPVDNSGSSYQAGGGGIYNLASLTVTNSTISGNKTIGGNGGGLYSRGSQTLTNTTISGNDAQGGGGIFYKLVNFPTQFAIVNNSTITNNSVFSGTAGVISITNSRAPFILNNSIVAGNENANDLSGITGSFTGSNNLIGSATSSGLINGVNGNLTNIANPGLAPLGNYGGLTQTHALLPESLAINFGSSTNAPATDQRGFPRVGKVDIGAFESDSSPTLANLTFTNPSIQEGDTGQNPILSFDLILNGPSLTPSNIDYSIIGGSAVEGVDYLPFASGTINFPVSNTTQTRHIGISIIGNQRVESNRAIQIILDNPIELALPNRSSTAKLQGTILDDDAPTALMVVDGDHQLAIVGSLFPSPLRVQVSNAMGHPVEGAVVTFSGPASGPSIFPDSITVQSDGNGIASSGTIQPNPIPGRNVVVLAQSPANPSLSLPFSLDTFPMPILSIESPSVSEGDNGDSRSLVFTVILAGPTLVAGTLDYSITGGSAAGGVDYEVLAAGTLIFPASMGFQTQTVTVQIKGNQLLQSDRSIQLTLNNPVNLSLPAGSSSFSTTGTIQDDDLPARLVALDGSGQSSVIGDTFPRPLVVAVLNANNHPVEGATVSFRSLGTEASASFQSSVTLSDSSGRAQSDVLLANLTGGSFEIQAEPVLGAGSVRFQLTNQIVSEIVSSFGARGSNPGELPLAALLNDDGGIRFQVQPYASTFMGGVKVAVGDVNGDGVEDLITATGPGGGPHIKVFDGSTQQEILSFFAYAPTFSGGVQIAVGDFNGDGRMDIVTGAGSGGGPHVQVYDGATGLSIRSFFAYGPGFSGGVQVATGDLNQDGVPDLITGTLTGAPHVHVFDGITGEIDQSFFAYGADSLGGVSVGAVKVGGIDRLITGAGAVLPALVNVYDSSSNLLNQFLAYDLPFRTGLRVSGNVAGEIVTGAGPGEGTYTVKRFNPTTGQELGSLLTDEVMFLGGVLVG